MNFKTVWFACLLLVACGESESKQPSQSEQPSPSVAILQYHHVAEDTPAVTSIRPDQFAKHLQYLVDNDYTVLGIEEAHRRINQNQPIPSKAVVITFDDGYNNVYDNAADLLHQHDMPYAIFVNPQLMRETPSAYMGWAQLKELQSQGATIVNHGQSHAHLTRRLESESQQQWRQRMRDDVLGAQQEIDEQLGPQPKYFAYPYGEYNDRLQQLLSDWGFLGFAQHSGPWSRYSPETAITRFPASGRYADLDSLATKLASLPMPVASVSPQDPMLSHQQATPKVTVELATTSGLQQSALRCYQGSQLIKPDWVADSRFSFKVDAELPIGRSRINCTAPSVAGSLYYWLSIPFIRPDASGSWPD